MSYTYNNVFGPSYPPKGSEVWRMPSDATPPGNSNGTQVIFTSVELTFSNWVNTPQVGSDPYWTASTINGSHPLTQDLSVLDDPFIVAYKDNFVYNNYLMHGHGLFVAKLDVGTSTYDDTVNPPWDYYTYLYFCLFGLGTGSETWDIGDLYFNFVAGSYLTAGLYWTINLEPKDISGPVGITGGGAFFNPTGGGLFGLKCNTAFDAQAWEPALSTANYKFALKLIK